MGSRGPRPLPANVHALNRNPSKKPFADLLDSVQPEIEVPSFPKHLWPEARKEWKRIGPELVANGLISLLDRAALALYCQAWAKMVWAEGQMTRAMERAAQGEAEAAEKGEAWKGGDGIMVPSPNGSLVYSHFWVVANKEADKVDKFLASFGMSPSSRGRVKPSNNRQAELPLEGAPGGFDGL